MREKLKIGFSERTQVGDSVIYKGEHEKVPFFVLSHPDSSEILVSPEIIGLDFYLRLKQPTQNILQFVSTSLHLQSVCVLNIMRGGLNFPIEESSHNIGLSIEGVSFVTTERRTDENSSSCRITDSKITLCNDATFVIGDIVASGDTLKETVRTMVHLYSLAKLRFKRIVLITFGTTETIRVIHEMNHEIRESWSDYEGITTFFYEGIFSAYNDAGITGFNTPHIDFVPHGEFVCPEYRQRMIDKKSAIFEKCAIYDGGDRRFEPYRHIDTLLAYWERLCAASDWILLPAFIKEKLGYYSHCTFDEWLRFNGYDNLTDNSSQLTVLFDNEQDMLQSFSQSAFAQLCLSRCKELKSTFRILHE